jgi:type IV pilus assembly protein PilM
MRFSIRPARTVGVDVGTFAVHAVALGRHRGRLVVRGVADAPIGRGADADAARAQTDAVAAVLDAPGCHRGALAAGVPGPTVLVRRLTVAPPPGAPMADAVSAALESQVPFALKEACLGWQPLESATAQPAGAVEVVAAVARRDRVAERMAVFAPAGRSLHVLDADACALVNAVTHSHPEALPVVQALVHVGHTSTLVCVAERGAPVFVRDISMAGRRYLQALDRELGLAPAEALRRLRLPDADAGLGGLLEEVHRGIAAEVTRTLQISAATGAHGPVQVVRVSGGVSRIPGLGRHLEAALDHAVHVFDPFVALDWPSSLDQVEWRPAFAVAVGLALREPGDHR